MSAAAQMESGFATAIAQKGMAMVPDVLSPTQCAAINDAIEWCRANPGPNFRTLSKPGEPVVQSDLFRWNEVPAIRDVAMKGVLPRLAAEVFGTDNVILMEDQWFYSEEGSGTPSPWHQDQPYHPLEPWFLTIWVPLDPVPGPVGIKAVPGSHLEPIYAPVEFSANDATLGDGGRTLPGVPDIDADPRRFPVAIPDAKPGDAVLLDSRTLHAAGGKCQGTFRRLSIRYAHPDTRYTPRAWPVAAFWNEHDIDSRYGERLESAAFPMIRATTAV